MAELLVKTHDDGAHKRGFVIDIMPDGWAWGDGEANSGEFVVVKVPGVDPGLLGAFTESEKSDGDETRDLQMRGFYLDLDGIQGPLKLKALTTRQLRVQPRFKD